MPRDQCDQMGLLFKGLWEKLSFKVAQTIGIFGYFENFDLTNKNCCGYHWATFGNILATLIPHLVPLLVTSISLPHLFTSCATKTLVLNREVVVDA